MCCDQKVLSCADAQTCPAQNVDHPCCCKAEACATQKCPIWRHPAGVPIALCTIQLAPCIEGLPMAEMRNVRIETTTKLNRT